MFKTSKIGLALLFLMLSSASLAEDLRYLDFVNSSWSKSSRGNWIDSQGRSGSYTFRISFENSDDSVFIKREYHWDDQNLVLEAVLDKHKTVIETIYGRNFFGENVFGTCRPGLVIESVESMRCDLTTTSEVYAVSEQLLLGHRSFGHSSTIIDSRAGYSIRFN